MLNIDDAGFDPIAAGGTIDHVIEVTNKGPNTATATQVRFAVPATSGLTGTIDPAGTAITNCAPTPAAAGVGVICDVPALVLDETASFTA